jgi:hypothetical protein
MTEPSAAPTPTARPFLAMLAAGLVLLSGAAMALHAPGPAHPVPKDFGQYWVAGKLALRGQLDALYFADLEHGLTEHEFPNSEFVRTAHEFGIPETSYFLYPPWVAWMCAPLALLPPWPAFALAYALCALAIFLSFALLARALPAWGAEAALVTFAAVCLSPPVYEAMASAQASILLLLLLALFARALARDRDVEAGAWWALMTGLKLFPLAFAIYLLARGRVRALFAGLAFGAGLAALSLLVGGSSTNLRFVDLMRAHAHYATAFDSNQSLLGFALRLTGAADPLRWALLPVPPGVEWPVRIAGLALLAVTLVLVVRATRSGDAWSGPLSLGLFTLWAFMIAPHAWMHHLVALAVPGTIAAGRLLATPRSRLAHAALWVAAWGLVIAFFGYQRLAGPGWSMPPRVLLASTPLYGALVLFALLALQCLALGPAPERRPTGLPPQAS